MFPQKQISGTPEVSGLDHSRESHQCHTRLQTGLKQTPKHLPALVSNLAVNINASAAEDEPNFLCSVVSSFDSCECFSTNAEEYDCALQAQKVTLVGICWRKIHLYVFSQIKSLKPHSLVFSLANNKHLYIHNQRVDYGRPYCATTYLQ